MVKIDDIFIRKYIDMLNTDFTVVQWVETNEVIQIYVVRKNFSIVCPECGRVLKGSYNFRNHYAVEDIPIYGKRTQVILCDRVYYRECKCGHGNQFGKAFDNFAKTYTTARYQDYIRVMCGPVVHKTGFNDVIGVNYSVFRPSDFWTEVVKYRNDNKDGMFYMYRDFLMMLNHLKLRYKNNRHLVNTELSISAQKLVLKFLEGENIIFEMQEKRCNSIKNNVTQIGDAYRLLLEYNSSADEAFEYLKGHANYNKAFLRSLREAEAYMIMFNIMKNTQMNKEGLYEVPKLKHLANGYDSYMQSVEKHYIEDNTWKDGLSDTDCGIIESLKELGYDTVYAGYEGNVRTLVLNGNNLSSFEPISDGSEIVKILPYVRVLDIDGSMYAFKVVSESRFYGSGYEKRLVYDSINDVVGIKGKYLWSFREGTRFNPDIEFEHGYYNEYASEHSICEDMLRIWISRINPEFTFIMYEESGEKVRVYVDYVGGIKKCIKCGSDKLKIKEMEIKITGLKFNTHDIEIVVTNHKVYKCNNDGIVFQQKYTLNTDVF